ncbi:TPA: hypothetical protein DCW38_04140, partial [candidate division WOR-3 bacterium]|nr:hypothetical protein [candidate division WOR-3 bacterium]
MNSISLVSDFEMESCSKDESEGHSIKIHFGENESVEPSAVTKGTSITTRDIFANMPGRLRFLK